MSVEKFPLYVKSTIDYHASQLATDNSLAYFDLDGAALISEMLLESDAPALAWSLGTFYTYPNGPLYGLEFDIGGKTSKDPAQYVSIDIAGLVSKVFFPHAEIKVRDYTGSTLPTQDLGIIYITQTGMMPAQQDRVAGLRLVNVQAKVQRF